jgi:hypothetical protein
MFYIRTYILIPVNNAHPCLWTPINIVSTQRPNPKKNMVYGTHMPELTIISPYADSRVDSNSCTMGNPMPESTLTLCKVDFVRQGLGIWPHDRETIAPPLPPPPPPKGRKVARLGIRERAPMITCSVFVSGSSGNLRVVGEGVAL